MSVRELFATALQHHRAGRLNEAELLYRQILESDSNHPDSLHMLGVLAHQTGQPQRAIEFIRRAIARNGAVPAFHNNLGNALGAASRWPEAEASYRRALAWKQDYAEAHYNLGGALRAQGKFEAAVDSYRHALTLRPNHVDTYLNMSNALQSLGMLEGAVEACRQAVSLNPNLPAAHNNLANLLAAQDRFEDALAAYARAVTLRPGFAEAHHNRGLTLLKLGRPEEAVAACRQALSLKTDYVAAYVILGNALRDVGRREEAEASYQRAVALNPDCGEARLGWAIAAIPLVADSVAEAASSAEQFRDRLNTLAQWSRANPGKLGEAVGTVQPFYLAYRPGDTTSTLCLYGDLASAAAAACWKPTAGAVPSARPRRERIRLAVVSGQLRRHPVWEIILRGLIAHLDRERFEIILYHTGAASNEETTWASAQVARFVQGPKPIRQWVAEIGEAQPDAIFYPEVGMDPNTCTLAALRLAPLQIAGWGHPHHHRTAHHRLVCVRRASRRSASPAALPRETHPLARYGRLYRIPCSPEGTLGRPRPTPGSGAFCFVPTASEIRSGRRRAPGAYREGQRCRRVLAGDTGKHALERGEVARPTRGAIPRARPGSRHLSAHHALAAAAAVSELSGRNGHLSGLPRLLRLHDSLAGVPLRSADRYGRRALPASAPGGRFIEASRSNRRHHSLARGVRGNSGPMGERMSGHSSMGRAAC